MTAHRCTEDNCASLPTHYITVTVESGDLTTRNETVGYCAQHATDVANELAHGDPPNVTLVSVAKSPASVSSKKGNTGD